MQYHPAEAGRVEEELLLPREILKAEDEVVADLAGVAERRGRTPVDVEIVHPEVIIIFLILGAVNSNFRCLD